MQISDTFRVIKGETGSLPVYIRLKLVKMALKLSRKLMNKEAVCIRFQKEKLNQIPSSSYLFSSFRNFELLDSVKYLIMFLFLFKCKSMDIQSVILIHFRKNKHTENDQLALYNMQYHFIWQINILIRNTSTVPGRFRIHWIVVNMVLEFAQIWLNEIIRWEIVMLTYIMSIAWHFIVNVL